MSLNQTVQKISETILNNTISCTSGGNDTVIMVFAIIGLLAVIKTGFSAITMGAFYPLAYLVVGLKWVKDTLTNRGDEDGQDTE